MLELAVLTKCAHTYTLQIVGIIESPQKGDSIVCRVCGKETTVLRVGIPHRVENQQVATDPNQKSMLKGS